MATAAGEAGSERAAHDPRARLRRMHEVGRRKRGVACCAQGAHSSRRANVLLACTASCGRAWRPLVSPCYRCHGQRSSRAAADAGIFLLVCRRTGFLPAACSGRQRAERKEQRCVCWAPCNEIAVADTAHACIDADAPVLLRVNLCLCLCICVRAHSWFSFLAIALASCPATSSLPVSLFLQAFTTLLDKTFESVPFDDFLGFFGRDFSETHRDYLFDLYSRSSAIPPLPNPVPVVLYTDFVSLAGGSTRRPPPSRTAMSPRRGAIPRRSLVCWSSRRTLKKSLPSWKK